MPALTANTVTLEEVLEVRGGPLTEEELWSVLAQSCDALQDVFGKGKARNRFFGSYSITPDTLLLCHNGRVKFSIDQDYPCDRSYTAPETYANRATPSDAALEKICVYSLGMSLYHAAEFEVAVGKPISLNESLEMVLLGMCEESARSRSELSQVMQECQSHYSRRNYKDIVTSLVESLLGDEMPDIELQDSHYDKEASATDTSDYDINEEIYPSSISPALVSPRNLPSPPLLQTSSRGQPTSVQLVGGNYRRVLTPPLTQRSTSPQFNGRRPLPPTLEKYRSLLENARSKRSMAKSLNGLDQLSSREPSPSTLQRLPPQHPKNGSEPSLYISPHHQKIPDVPYYGRPPGPVSDNTGYYYEIPPGHLTAESRTRLRPNGSRQDTQGLDRFDSIHSVASNSSSSASGPRSSMFSDGRSSSALSITQGSYAPDTYLTDGYDSEFNLKSFGSSVSRNAFRTGRDVPSQSDQKYLSHNDLRKPSTGFGSSITYPLPSDHHYRSLPNINKFKEFENEKTMQKGQDNLKTFFGPEFVMITEDPEKSIVNITPISQLKKDGQKKGSHTSHRKIVTVVALNGQKLQLMAEVSMTTKDLYEQVIRFLGVTEKIFFGLAKLEDDEVIFLDLDVKLSKYAPPKWKEAKGEMLEFILYLRVKFYVEHTALLSHPTSRHQFYLQLRKDILEGRLYCHDEAAFILGGIALQAETGDYVDSLDGDYFLVEHYLNERVINKISEENAINQLPEFHRNFAGLTEEQAEVEFIQEAQKLPEYGIHFYAVQFSKKSDGSEKLYLGICVRGVTVYESRGNIKSPIHKHSWPLTKKLSFKKKKFFIEPRSGPDGVKLTFYTNHYKKAKYLLQMCTAFHRFQMKMRARLASIEHEMAGDLAIENQHQMVDGPTKVYDRAPAPSSYKQNSIDISIPRSVSTEYKEKSVDIPDERYHSLPRSVSTEYIESTDNIPEKRHHLPRSISKQYSVDENRNKDNHGNQTPIETHGKHDNVSPYVIDSTLNGPSKQETQDDDTEDIPPKTPDGEISNSRDILSSPDREIRVIKFTKEPGKGLGITVLGGENSKRLDRGIYIKSVTEGGAAARDGRLKAGDRILAVNGNSLEQVTHERAVTLLKTITSTVELVVSQSPHNASALDLSNIPSVGSTNEEPQTLEVKPLITPPQHDTRHSSRTRVGSTWSSDTQSPTESHPSTFNFPSEEEPVTMISKSISSLATPQSSSHSVPSRGKDSPSNYLSVSPPGKRKTTSEVDIPDPVTMATLETPAGSLESNRKLKSPLLSRVKLSSAEFCLSDISNESQSSFTAGSVGSEMDHGNSIDSDDLPDKSFTVELEKIDKSLGLSVTGGINTTVKLGGIYVKSLMLNGPADRDGRIRIGDRILEVDGISLIGVTHKQAVEVIRRAPQRCKIVLDRSIHVNVPASIKKNSSRTQPTDKPFVVELVKGIGGLGLSLVGGRDAGPEHGGLLRIKKMFPGQPAILSKKLALGDIVLEVNGKSLENATHQDAINMIRHEVSVVRLLVKRDPSSIPAVLLSRASSNASDVDPVQLLNDIQNKLRSETTSPVHSPPQETQTRITETSLQSAGQIRVNPEERIGRNVAYENERPLQHQLSDPSALISKQKDHEPVATSHSLPGKISLKSRYFDNRPEEKDVTEKNEENTIDNEDGKSIDLERKSSDSNTSESERRRPFQIDRKDSGKIFSESDIPSLLQHIRSQDSLKRIMSPRAPLAEYEESDLDIDEGIMVSVDDGIAVSIDDDDDDGIGSDGDDDVDTAAASGMTTNDSYQVGDQNEISVDATNADDSDGNVGGGDDGDDDDDDDDDDIGAAATAVTVDSDKSDVDEVDDINDVNDDNTQDIDAVLELLSNDHQKSNEAVVEKNLYKLDNQEVENSDSEDSEHSVGDFKGLAKEESVNNLQYMTNTRDGQCSSSEDSLNEKLERLEDTIVESNPDLTEISTGVDSTLTPKEQLITVELEKGSGGLGFTLAGGADTMGGCFVRDIIGDPAKSDGRLHKGDQILQVDDIDIRNMKHMEAVNVLRATKTSVKMVVLRRPTTVVTDSKSGQLESVNLTRTSRGRIGLLLKEDDDGVILVDDVVPGEPASVEGNLKHGDVIVEIGGRKVEGIGFLAARQYLDAARPVVRLLVKRTNRVAVSKYRMGSTMEQSFSFSEDLPEDNAISSDESDDDQESDDIEESKDDVFNVQLDKGLRGFGFSLVAAPSTEPNVQGIFIKTISTGSVAEKDGRLKVGDQLLKVNDEDVRGLSHARVIGMLRKVTTTVDLQIKRPGDPLNQTRSKEGGKSKIPKDSSPQSNSLDLEITLEDKESLTGSSEVKDEDEIIDLLNAISEANSEFEPPNKNTQTKPTIHKRDTDSVLSSILSSIAMPSSPPYTTPSLPSHNKTSPPSHNTTTSPPYNNTSPPHSLPTHNIASPSSHTLPSPTSHTTFFQQSHTKTSPPSRNTQSRHSPPPSPPRSPLSPPSHTAPQADFKEADSINSDSDVDSTNRASSIDDNIPGYSTDDSVQRHSSGSSEGKRLSDSSNEKSHEKTQSVESSDSDYDDMNVFDMLQDNSEAMIKMLKESDDIGSSNEGYIPSTLNGTISDVPPPVPTTPIPSDDDEKLPAPPPRRESLFKLSDDGWSSGDSDISSKHKLNGFVTLQSSSSESDMSRKATGPLIDVTSGGRYTGQKLKMMIGALQSKIDSNVIADEFKALREIKPTDDCSVAKQPVNKEKNRYRNVLPFNKTRVHLSGHENEDYINASHIKVPVGQDTYHYIATQGPLPNTAKDFWQMIWEQNVEVIAMATLEKEGGKVKCHRYWPDLDDQQLVIPRKFRITLQRKKNFDSFVERKFSLKHLGSGESIEVTHLNFTTWPDHGVPKCSIEMVQFVTHMRKLTTTQAPIVVHCSAGIGRTGALITVDVSLGLMQRDLMFDVDKIIRILREQRHGMIQTKDQNIFCYKACLEVLRSLDQ